MGQAEAKNSIQQAATAEAINSRIRKIERREWWLWASAILVTLLLTLGIISFALPVFPLRFAQFDATQVNTAVRGLVAMVLLFDIYTVYQQLQIYRIRRRLVEREELFRLISENAADMIALVDANGRRLYNSPAYQKVLGYSPEELQSTVAWEQVHPEDREKVQEAAREAFRGVTGRRIEYRMRHKDGNWCVLESTSSGVRDRDGKIEKLVVVNRDISNRRKLEEQFRQVQKMEAVGRLSGGIAHDFNNLLGVIIGYTEILEERLEKTNPLRASVDEILRAGRHAASLTRQLLAFSRQQVLQARVLDLNAVISDLQKMLRRLIGEDIELTTELDPDLARVKADEGQLEQILMNMAVNARDAMPEGGKLVIETANAEMDETFVQRYPYPVKPGWYVLLTVSDTGVGMDGATKAKIFEPFFTTKEKGKGTGLGLAMVYGVVKQSGGYIDVESELGVGTTFKIYLPRVEEEIAVENVGEAPGSALVGSETLLLVEDETSLRTLTRNLLEGCGYTVLDAREGNHALEISQQYAGPIHLLLTDVVMPGMNGRALAKQLSEQRPEMKVVYMSGYTGQTIDARGSLDPGSIFLQKPFTREELAKKVREGLDAVKPSKRG